MVLLFRIVVDGETFEVRKEGPTNHFDWITGPNPGYGFFVGRSDGAGLTRRHARERIRGFLRSVDPVTGYLEG